MTPFSPSSTSYAPILFRLAKWVRLWGQTTANREKTQSPPSSEQKPSTLPLSVCVLLSEHIFFITSSLFRQEKKKEKTPDLSGLVYVTMHNVGALYCVKNTRFGICRRYNTVYNTVIQRIFLSNAWYLRQRKCHLPNSNTSIRLLQPQRQSSCSIPFTISLKLVIHSKESLHRGKNSIHVSTVLSSNLFMSKKELCVYVLNF